MYRSCFKNIISYFKQSKSKFSKAEIFLENLYSHKGDFNNETNQIENKNKIHICNSLFQK